MNYLNRCRLLEIVVGGILLAAGLAAIFTGSPWVGSFLVVVAIFVGLG